MELAEPDIPAAAAKCVERGATEVRMLPYFLSMGTHVAGDLEEFRAAFAERYPEVRFEVRPPLGLHPEAGRGGVRAVGNSIGLAGGPIVWTLFRHQPEASAREAGAARVRCADALADASGW